MEKMFSKLCTPAKIYFGIAVIASIAALFRGVTFSFVLMKMVFAFFWTYVLGWLCKKGYSYISWFLVLLPYVVILLAALRIANITQHRQIYRSVGLQGAYGQEAFGIMREGVDDTLDKKKEEKESSNPLTQMSELMKKAA
jgi:hypothetical protein